MAEKKHSSPRHTGVCPREMHDGKRTGARYSTTSGFSVCCLCRDIQDKKKRMWVTLQVVFQRIPGLAVSLVQFSSFSGTVFSVKCCGALSQISSPVSNFLLFGTAVWCALFKHRHPPWFYLVKHLLCYSMQFYKDGERKEECRRIFEITKILPPPKVRHNVFVFKMA